MLIQKRYVTRITFKILCLCSTFNIKGLSNLIPMMIRSLWQLWELKRWKSWAKSRRGMDNDLCSSHISNPWTLPPPMLPGEVIGNKCAQDFDLVQTQDFSGGFSGSRVLVVMKIPAFVLFWQGGGTEWLCFDPGASSKLRWDDKVGEHLFTSHLPATVRVHLKPGPF